MKQDAIDTTAPRSKRYLSYAAASLVALTGANAHADLVDCPASAGAAALVRTTDKDAPSTSGSTGISDSTDPALTLLSEADITNVDTQKLALGFGLERAAPWSILRAAVRFNPNGALATTVRSSDLGVAINAPGTATFSVSGRIERYLGAYIQGCKVTGGTERRIHTKWGHGLYGSIEVARIHLDARRSDDSVISGAITPVALAGGYFVRLDGRLPASLNLGSQYTLAPYLGVAIRGLDDDLHEQLRTEVLGSKTRVFGGLEAGATLQFGNFVFQPRATLLSNGDHHVNGVSGLQLQITLSYSLFLGGAPANTHATSTPLPPSS